MKNLLIAMILVLGGTGMINAQTNFGAHISVGANLAESETTYSGEAFDYINHEVNYRGSNIVKSAGLFAQQKFGYLYVKGEASYTQFTQEYFVRSFVQFRQQPTTVYDKLQMADFQVMAGLTHKDYRFGVGPVVHVLLDHETPLEFISAYRDERRTVQYGFAVGLGLDAGHFHFDVKYENGFTPAGDHIRYGERNARSKSTNNIVSFTVGYSI